VEYRPGMVLLQTVPAVIDAFGGNKATSALFNRSEKAVSNWRRVTNRFPAVLFRPMSEELEKRGLTAPPELWGQE
jgi:hypothetical protein